MLAVMDILDEQRDWIAKVLAATGLAPSALAAKAGLSPTTLTRFLNSGEHATALSHRTISAVEKSTGIAFGADLRPRLLRKDDASGFVPSDAGGVSAYVANIIQGTSLTAWTLKSRALETVGFVPGDVMIVDLNEPAQPGDAVLAQVYDFKSMKAETLFRLYEPPFLHAASFERTQTAPILIDQSVGIKGPVVLSIRPRLILAAA